jgi:hypothetical protein
MIRTQIQLTEEQASRVKQLASSRGVPMAEVIREAVEAAIAAGTGPASEERRNRALTIAGKFRSGKKDISRKHDAYLTEAFGK